jgi:GrpB-like predicted nucleotidyltransferase (UPF0157 family)
MQKRPYYIEPYNSDWALQYIQIEKDLKQSFGDKPLSIEHTGSTSIPGMSAKSLIDVLVVVEKMQPFTEEKESMAGLGYKYKDNYINPDTIMFYKEKEDLQKTINIHVVEDGSFDEQKFHLVTNYLKKHPERAQMYMELKKKLNEQFPDDYPAYRAGKADFLEETKRLAIEEKAK